MKIVNVPYSKFVQSVIDGIITIAAMIGISVLIGAIFQLDLQLFILGILIGVPTSIYTWKIMTLELIIMTNALIRGIIDINENGFTILKNKKRIILTWDEIEYVRLNENNDLLIKRKKGKQIKVEKEYPYWYLLLQSIPQEKLKDSQIPDFIKTTFENLKTCQICGNIAFQQEKCLSCGSVVFNEKMKLEFENEIEYIKEEQLDLFGTEDKFEQVDFYSEPENGFELDKNWKPIVTEKEVIEYSKEYNWD